jgi:hypothetical protein
MSALVLQGSQPFEELFCQTWAFCGFRTQWFSSGNIKSTFISRSCAA